MKNKDFKKLSTIILGFLMLVLVVLGIFLLLMFILFVSRNENGYLDYNMNLYRYYQYDPSTNKGDCGLTPLFPGFSEDEFISEEDTKGNHILVSNFGDLQFECTGSCFCSETRRMTVPIVRGLIYLVASVSSLLAYELSRKHFEEVCQERLRSICTNENMIVSEVDDCQEVTTMDNSFEELEEEWDKDNEHEVVGVGKSKYPGKKSLQWRIDDCFFLFDKCYLCHAYCSCGTLGKKLVRIKVPFFADSGLTDLDPNETIDSEEGREKQNNVCSKACGDLGYQYTQHTQKMDAKCQEAELVARPCFDCVVKSLICENDGEERMMEYSISAFHDFLQCSCCEEGMAGAKLELLHHTRICEKYCGKGNDCKIKLGYGFMK